MPSQISSINDLVTKINTGVDKLPGGQNFVNLPTLPLGTPVNPPPKINQNGTTYDQVYGGGNTGEPTLGSAFGLGDINVSDEIFSNTTSMPGAVNEAEIRQQALARRQNEVDAANMLFDRLVDQARTEGLGREGEARAVAARGGLLGSDFATANRNKVKDATAGSIGDINAQRAARISSIMFDIENTASDEISKKQAAREKGTEEYLQFLRDTSKRKDERFSSTIESLIAQGVDPSTLSNEDFASIESNLGKNKNAVLSAFNKAKAEAEAAGAQQKFENEIKSRTADREDTRVGLEEKRFELSKEGTSLTNQLTRSKIAGQNIENQKKSDSDDIELTDAQRRTLLGSGWSQGDVKSLEEGIRTYGIDTVIKSETDAGASPQKIEALRSAYSAPDTQQFLSKDYFKSIFTPQALEEAAAKAGGFGDLGEGVFNLKDVDTDGYLGHLENTVKAYREAGFTDKEILKLMQQ